MTLAPDPLLPYDGPKFLDFPSPSGRGGWENQGLEVSDPKESSWTGVVERITFRNAENGWTILKVAPSSDPRSSVPVVVAAERVYPGAHYEFFGEWTVHAQYGRQFRASRMVERAPTSSASLEKYLGSGLIKGIGPKTAQKIVATFGNDTLGVFDQDSEKLLRIPGISRKKLEGIMASWGSQRSARDAVVFLQSHGIGPALAGRIFKYYGEKTVATVRANPYRLAYEVFGVGFATADQIGRELGIAADSELRIRAGVRQVLYDSRNDGHCYLTKDQLVRATEQLLGSVGEASIVTAMDVLLHSNEICARQVTMASGNKELAYYDYQLFLQEAKVAARMVSLLGQNVDVDRSEIEDWLNGAATGKVELSQEQRRAVEGIARSAVALLTGGPGCGKTTTMETMVRLMQGLGRQVVLAAPTGRAAQRMSEVIGVEAKTIHRLLEWNPQFGGFRRNAQEPLDADFVVVDETSMMDMGLAAALLDAVPTGCQLLLVGDPDQLPSVGAGNVLADLLAAPSVPQFRLTQVFRQAQKSSIVRHAHTINGGHCPEIASPVGDVSVWERGEDCLFLDADEPTSEEIEFIGRATKAMDALRSHQSQMVQFSTAQGKAIASFVQPEGEAAQINGTATTDSSRKSSTVLRLPPSVRGGQFARLSGSLSLGESLRLLERDPHPWSTLQFGMTAVDTVRHLYMKTIPEKCNGLTEIQVLSPQVRGTLGTANLNTVLQASVNPPSPNKDEIKIGDRVLRVGDRVMQTRNNYELAVFNGDIGRITLMDSESDELEVTFGTGLDERAINYDRTNLGDLTLAYAITIHKSQGSEFPAVIIPLVTQHFTMLYRNLIYTGLTRARRLAVLVGDRKALQMAVRRQDNRLRQSALKETLEEGVAESHV